MTKIATNTSQTMNLSGQSRFDTVVGAQMYKVELPAIAAWSLLSYSSSSVGTPVTNAPRVMSYPGVCGGDPCISGTRIPVWALENARRLGADDSEILRMYPMLDREDLRAARQYVVSHREDIDRQIRENEDA